MKIMFSAGEERARSGSVVPAESDHVVEGLAEKLGNVFGPLVGDVDADFPHDGDGQGMHFGGHVASARHLEFFPSQSAEQASAIWDRAEL
jgi:hypothetical protein